MSVPEATRPIAAPTRFAAGTVAPAGAVGALAWAGAASTLHRLRVGEGALLAVNLSLVAVAGGTPAQRIAGTVVSVVTIAAMYALNDLWDAPSDWSNPKKDRALVGVYARHRAAAGAAVLAAHVAIVALALATLDARGATAVAVVMAVNVAYSAAFKGIPVLDVAWCGLWGASYAAIVDAEPSRLALVAVMTAVCHLFQTLDDRIPDAANGITTTAVHSPRLVRAVVVALSLALFVVLRGPLGPGAATALLPLVLFGVAPPRRAWLLTKAYFAAVWLVVLGVPGALR